MIYIGCHLSIGLGYFNMAKLAKEIGANTFQFFTRNPRGGAMKKIDGEDMHLFNEFLSENNFGKIVAHAPYTLNPCSDKERVREFGRSVIKEDLEIMEMMPGNIYNFHPGSHVGQGVDAGIKFTTDLLNEVLREDMTTIVAIETMAGKATEIGRNFSEIKRIIDGVDLKERVGVCLDTCHVFESGMDIREGIDEVLLNFDREIGLEKLVALHLNDSKNDCGAKKDRHELIGKGSIGIDVFKEIVNDERLKKLPLILETPTDEEGHRVEIELLRSFEK
ncbi:endonuclease IV [Tissierellia bacterium S7-1-4]|nr:endonuclease IV [Tissierellia bacterium S7-1-4]